MKNNIFGVFDIPFILLLAGTFAFGRAFSVLGIKCGVVSLFPTEIVLIIMSGLILLRRKIDNFGLWLPNGISIGLFMYLVIGTVYLFIGLTRNGLLALRDIVFSFYSLFLFITILVFDTEKKLKAIFWIFIPSGIIAILIGLNTVFKIISEDSYFGQFILNIKGFNSDLYCGLIVLFGISFLSLLKKKNFLVAGMIILALAVNLLLPARAGWVAMGVSLVFLNFILKNEFRNIIKRYWLMFSTLFIFLIFVSYFRFPDIFSSVKERICGFIFWGKVTRSTDSVIWRFSLWGQTVDRILKHPFLGWGFGSYPDYILWGRPAPPVLGIGPDSGITPAHNHILAITYKMGLVGLVLFLFINLKTFFYGFKYIKRCKLEFNRRFLIACLAGLVYWHTMALFFDIIESPPTSIFLWILLGLILSVVKIDANLKAI